MLGLLAPPAEATTYRTRLLRIINHSRLINGRKPLKINLSLSEDAKAHTRKMIRRGKLYDVPNLSQVLSPYKWSTGGDVVGCGDTLIEMHRLLMRHAYHRKIILSRKFTYVGIGVIKVDGKSACGRNSFWATEIFYG